MTVAIDHAGARRQRSEAAGAVQWRSRSFRLVAAGLVGLVAAAWGGIIPFVGPTFGFSADGTGSWYWDLGHSLLALIPGAAGVIAAITIMGFGLSRRKLFGLGLAGLLAAVAGAWFVIGPFAWPVLYSSRSYFVTASSPLQGLGHFVGYALGPGVLLAIVGGVAWGAAEDRGAVAATGEPVAMRPAEAVTTRPAEAVTTEDPAAPAAGPTTTAPPAPVPEAEVPPMDPVHGATAHADSPPASTDAPAGASSDSPQSTESTASPGDAPPPVP